MLSENRGLDLCLEGEIKPIIEQYQQVVVFCSGGADSTALFKVFYDFSNEKINFSLSIFHINFGLRSQESDEDEAFVTQLGMTHKVPCKVFKADLATNKESNIQNWARNLRISFAKDYIKQGYLVAYGHHLGDSAEGLMIKLFRGTTLQGFFPLKSFDNGVLRPFLNHTKNEILDYLERKNLPHRQDSSNAKMVYSRNIIRHQTFEALKKPYPRAQEKLIKFSTEVQELMAFVESLNLSKEMLTSTYPCGVFSFSREKIQKMPFFIFQKTLLDLLPKPKDNNHVLTQKILSQILEDLKSSIKEKTFNLPGGYFFQIKDQDALLFRRLRKPKNEKNSLLFFKQFQITNPVSAIFKRRSVEIYDSKALLLKQKNNVKGNLLN